MDRAKVFKAFDDYDLDNSVSLLTKLDSQSHRHGSHMQMFIRERWDLENF